MRAVRIATRGSDLALVQARWVADRLCESSPIEPEPELVVVKTTGDRLVDVPLAEVGGKGLFIKEIEEALLDGRADIAVHSAKDLPAKLAPGLTLAAFPERADPRDALVARAAHCLSALARGARVGTGSVRRSAQLLALRPDLEVIPLRGNVPTRLSKLDGGDLDALLLACAGLDRLALGDRIVERIDPELMLPAPCQGVLALQAREGEPIVDTLAALGHGATSLAARAERAFLARLGGDCSVPAGALAEVSSDSTLRLRGLVASPDGGRFAGASGDGTVDAPEALGVRIADRVLEGGGAEILAALEGFQE